jgi:surface antigen
MKSIFTFFICIFTSLSLLGCSNMNKQDVGTLSGGVAGGLLGSQFGGGTGKLLAIGAGTLAGALIGGSVGKSMDDTDRLKTQRALETQPVGQPAYWQNAKTGTQYTVTPTKNVTVNGNRYCREYRTTAVVAGKDQQIYGTACRQPDGSWKVVS